MISQQTIEELLQVERDLGRQLDKCLDKYGHPLIGKAYTVAWLISEARKFHECIQFLEDLNENDRIMAELPIKVGRG